MFQISECTTDYDVIDRSVGFHSIKSTTVGLPMLALCTQFYSCAKVQPTLQDRQLAQHVMLSVCLYRRSISRALSLLTLLAARSTAEPCWLLRSHLFRLGSVIDGKCRQTDSAGTAPKALHNFLLPLHVNQQYLDAMNFEVKLYTHLPTLYSSPKTAVHNVHVRLYVYMTNMYIQGNELSFLSSSSWSWVKPF